MRKLVLLVLLFPMSAWSQSECPDYADAPDRLRDLEALASRGALSDDEKDCLEAAYARVASQTVKDKISRVLMVNGYAYSTSYWADLVRRHLDEVDRSDPDIAYLYAFHLFNTAPERAEEAITWAEVALERKDAWTGAVYTGRVYGLLRLRSVAAMERWRRYDAALVRGEGEPAESERLRNETKTYAREWVDFAVVSGRDVTEARGVCVSAASAAACGEVP